MKTIPRPASAGAAALLFFLPGSPAAATPVRYRYDDTQLHSPGGWGPLGVGEFTLEVGPELGDYVAWDIQGGPGSRAGLWTSVIFSAQPGNWATLYVQHSYDSPDYANPFQIRVGSNPEYPVDPHSSAAAEWARLLAYFAEGNRHGMVLTPVSIPTGVPESDSLGWATAIGLGLAALYCRRRHRARAATPPVHSGVCRCAAAESSRAPIDDGASPGHPPRKPRQDGRPARGGN